jgi:lipid-binding SYLF domain-containing protein
MTRALAALLSSTLLLAGVSGCETAPDTVEGRAEIVSDADRSLAKAKTSDSSLAALLDRSAGYAVFPSVGKGAVGIGGAYGKGVVYERGMPIGYTDLTQGTIGFQLGGQSYTEILVFENQAALNKFKEGNVHFDAQATAVALKSGAAANAKFTDGVAVFTMDEAGLMFEASIGGQKFSYEPM